MNNDLITTSLTEIYRPKKINPRLFLPPDPLNQEDIFIRSKIRIMCMQNMYSVLKNIFKNGFELTKDFSIVVSGDWYVFIKGGIDSHLNEYIVPGGWVNKKTFVYGYDLIELLAEYQGCEYQNALKMLINFFAKNQSYSAQNQWFQITTPMSLPMFYLPQKKQQLAKSYEYKNVFGQTIGIVDYHSAAKNNKTTEPDIPATKPDIPINTPINPSSDFFYFYTIWKHNESCFYDWFEIMPDLPYPWYNADIIANCPNSPIFIVKNESIAESLLDRRVCLSGCFKSFDELRTPIFTTCPGGLSNLTKTNFSIFKNRSVVICIGPKSPAVNNLPMAIKLMTEQRVDKIAIYFINLPLIDFDPIHKILSTDLNSSMKIDEVSEVVTASDFLQNKASWGIKDIPVIDNSEQCPPTKKIKKLKNDKISKLAKIYHMYSESNQSIDFISDSENIGKQTLKKYLEKIIPNLSGAEKIFFDTALKQIIDYENTKIPDVNIVQNESGVTDFD